MNIGSEMISPISGNCQIQAMLINSYYKGLIALMLPKARRLKFACHICYRTYRSLSSAADFKSLLKVAKSGEANLGLYKLQKVVKSWRSQLLEVSL